MIPFYQNVLSYYHKNNDLMIETWLRSNIANRNCHFDQRLPAFTCYDDDFGDSDDDYNWLDSASSVTVSP